MRVGHDEGVGTVDFDGKVKTVDESRFGEDGQRGSEGRW